MDFNKLQLENKIKFIGRTRLDNDKLYMNFSGSGVKLKVLTEKLVVKMFSPKYNDANSYPYISIIIDDSRYDYGLFEENQEIKLTLSNIPHTIEILKRTESSVSFAAITDIVADRFLEVEKEDKLKIEFFGDSLTCGYGVLCNNPNLPFTTHTESFLDSYAYLTSKMLNADYSVISVSGFPIYKSRWNEGFPIESVADMSSISDYSEDMTPLTTHKWDNSKFIPNIVVINLGTNDCSYFTEGEAWVDELVKEKGSYESVINESVFQKELFNLGQKVKEFLQQLFNLYGNNIKIVWALGMIGLTDCVSNTIYNALAEFNNPNVFPLKFSSLLKSNDFGANWHPGAMMHHNAALELVELIENIIKGDN